MSTSGKRGKAGKPAAAAARLPQGYGSTEATLLAIDPGWMFLYWEISPNSRRELERKHGSGIFEKGRETLRVYDLDPEGLVRRGYSDTPVMLDSSSWYVRLGSNGGCHSCELGLLMPSGDFIGIVESNHVGLPPGHVSEATDAQWGSVSGDFDRLLQLSGVEYIGKGSGEVAKSLAQRWEMLSAVFSRAAAWGMSSLSSRPVPAAGARGFRLLADCEVVLYGSTEPDALVTVSGRHINLNPDGTFSMRFALPDGRMDLPLSAISADGKDLRELRISVKRRTGEGEGERSPAGGEGAC